MIIGFPKWNSLNHKLQNSTVKFIV